VTDMIFRLQTEGVTPETSRPDPARVLSGDPVFTTWNLEEAGGLYAGIWACTPGKWRISYEEWEYCRILEGRCVVTGDDGSVLEAGPGDSFVLRPGFEGTWEVIERVVKEYVIRI